METKNYKKSILPVCCESCKTSCNTSGDEFRKLLNLSNSGLIVYINTYGKPQMNKKESVILHNVGDKALKKQDFIDELRRRKTKCYLCNTLIQRVCNLVNEVTEIKENEMIAVCEHCKRTNATNKCKKCDEMVKKFLNNEINQYRYHQQALKIRLYEVRRILSFIVDKKNICDHKICQAYYDSNAELKILLELIKSPLPSKRSDIEEYFSLMEKDKETIHDNIDNTLLLKYSGFMCESSESFNSIRSGSESFCICKYLRDRNFDSSKSLEFSPVTQEPLQKIYPPTALKDITEKLNSLTDTKQLENKPKKEFKEIKNVDHANKKNIKVKSTRKKNKQERDKQETEDVDKENISETTKRHKNEHKSIDNQRLLTIIAKEKKRKQIEKVKIKEKYPAIPVIAPLPDIKHVAKEVQIEKEDSGSIIECGQNEPLQPNKMILGKQIVPFHEHPKMHHKDEPLFFNVKHEFTTEDKTLISTSTTTTTTTTASKKINLKTKSHSSADTKLDGIINYELSNRKFIENGWTKLPSVKILRRMNLYKMVPANPQFDWFENHKGRNTLFYNSGEKLAEVDENGCGRWFYKNGRVGLEYYKAKDVMAQLKYVVYDCDDIIDGKKNKPQKILATFDHLGNGIIYDNIRNVRLKYNQSEGLVIDKKIGPPGRWKWHTLNDPPVLQQVYTETLEEYDQCFKNVVKQEIYDAGPTKRLASESVLAIEFSNFVKEKASKMLKNFKHFEIRMKTVKINEYFSVRIIDQANIQLLFRCSQVPLKVNMGMLLVSTEIIDTIVSDVSDVATPFDGPISRSKSVNSI